MSNRMVSQRDLEGSSHAVGRVFGVVVALSVLLSLGKFLPLSSIDDKRVRELVSADSDLAQNVVAHRSAAQWSALDRRAAHSGAAACARSRSELPTLGSASPGVVVLNPYLLNRQPDAVRLFVFHHECGHHLSVRASWGLTAGRSIRALRQGWLDHQAVEQVCQDFGIISFGHASSGARRCAKLRQCCECHRRGRWAESAGAAPAGESWRVVHHWTLIWSGTRGFRDFEGWARRMCETFKTAFVAFPMPRPSR